MSNDRFSWPCDGCGKAIADGTGWIHIDETAAFGRIGETEEWRRTHGTRMGEGSEAAAYTFGALSRMPRDIPWKAHHEECDPSHGVGYGFDVARARTAFQVLDWTLHLMEKTWFTHTDWNTFLRKHSPQPLEA